MVHEPKVPFLSNQLIELRCYDTTKKKYYIVKTQEISAKKIKNSNTEYGFC